MAWWLWPIVGIVVGAVVAHLTIRWYIRRPLVIKVVCSRCGRHVRSDEDDPDDDDDDDFDPAPMPPRES